MNVPRSLNLIPVVLSPAVLCTRHTYSPKEVWLILVIVNVDVAVPLTTDWTPVSSIALSGLRIVMSVMGGVVCTAEHVMLTVSPIL